MAELMGGSDNFGTISMDSLITAAALALAAGDPLGALNRVALRGDPAALAIRGIAMAQLGDLARARTLVRSAARAFGPREAVARARCIVAEAEIALASRELNWPAKRLENARATLQAHGDHANAAHGHILEVRRLLLTGRLDEAEQSLAGLEAARLPPVLRATHYLITAGIAMRRLRTGPARAALERAARDARQSNILMLEAEVEHGLQVLAAPSARLLAQGRERQLTLEEVEAVMASPAFVVDACRNVIRHLDAEVRLATRPVLFVLARALAEAWPKDVPRDELIHRAFRTRHVDDTYRVRLRVELGRLRAVLAGVADVSATPHGYALVPRRACEVVVLAPPVDEAHAAVLACLADGESWSSSALAMALGTSQRTMQRALDSLAAAAKVHAIGQGRARRWVSPPLPGFATSLLLPAVLPRQ
jgi:DNA-binding transcriptional ArsR family regulator